MGSIPIVVETAYILVVESLSLMAHPLPLADLFFLILPFFNCLTCFFIILFDLLYYIFEVLFWFPDSFFILYPLNFVP